MADNPFYKNVQAGFGAIDNMYRQPQSNVVVRQGTAAQMAREAAARAAQLNTGSSGSTKKPSSSSLSSGSTAQVSGGSDLQSYLQGLYSQRQQAAQNAYENSMNALNKMYSNQRNALTSSLQSASEQLDNSHNNSLGKIDNSAKKSLQEAYINRKLSERNLGQQLAAQGMSGGASESAMAGLANAYGNSRNGITDTWNTNKADLENTYQNSLANILQEYNSNLAQLESQRAQYAMQLQNNLQGGITDSVGDFTSMLMSNPSLLKAIASSQNTMDAYAPADTVATNQYNAVNTQQANDTGFATQYAKYINSLQDRANKGYTAKELTNYATNNLGIIDNSIIKQLLDQIR